ncbi:threonine aldolase family protein [Robiginitalea sp.]|uniref:threonine aldolase family protein n=1 Tax=Robiginitalea sp. TaxID=1902411 RepID=UPI003C440138
MEVNLISDTVTRPNSGMLKAMMGAAVGDDVFKEDPTVNELETEVARLFGMESALFFPSGTMANQTGIKLHTEPGDQLICDKYAHVYNYEGGGVSFNSGVSCRLVDGNRGMMTAGQVEGAINPPDFYHSPKTALVCIENTTNKGGGACWDFQELREIKKVCDRHQLRYHLDGARIWNALAATPEGPEAYGALFDTISVCLSKGLGCPVGSLLLGSQQSMEKALRIRKVLGGGMRQAGYLAAAGLYALENNRGRLAEDHRRAKEIGAELQNRDFVTFVAPVETNIVIFEVDTEMTSDTHVVRALNEKGIRLIGMGEGKLRLVTHLDYTEQMHQYVLATLKNLEPVKA